MALFAATTRLLLEPLGPADVEAFTAYRRNPDVARWQSWTEDYAVADAERLVTTQPSTPFPAAGEWLQLAVKERGSPVLLGDVAVHRLTDQPDTFEVGVTLDPAAQGRGVGTEAVAAAIDRLFAGAGAHRVVAFCDARNSAVARLLVRVGMRQESRQVEADWFKGEWTTLDGYALLAREHAEHRWGYQP